MSLTTSLLFLIIVQIFPSVLPDQYWSDFLLSFSIKTCWIVPILFWLLFKVIFLCKFISFSKRFCLIFSSIWSVYSAALVPVQGTLLSYIEILALSRSLQFLSPNRTGHTHQIEVWCSHLNFSFASCIIRSSPTAYYFGFEICW